MPIEKAVKPLADSGGQVKDPGELTEQAAAWTGLLAGTPIAVANVDAHVSAPAVRVTEPGALVMIMGTSTCHILLGDRPAVVEGMCGMVEDGVVPGLYGFEAGQSAVGDIFAWFADLAMTPHEVLERAAATLRPGQSGLLALDWWNGNRSILVTYTGILPDLFREGQGVVTEGALDVAGTFRADSVLAKHDETYMPKEVADALKKQGHWKTEGGGYGLAGATKEAPK